MIALEAFVMTAPAYFDIQDTCNSQQRAYDLTTKATTTVSCH